MLIRRTLNNKGTTVVEFAVVVPLFFLLIFGIIDFGWYFFVEHTLQYATREGMRLALVGRKLMDENGNSMSREASIIKTIKDNASLAVNPSSLSIHIFPIGGDYNDPENWENFDPDAGDPGSYMRVKTRYTYNFLTPLIGAFFTGGNTLVEAQGTYRNELFDM
jgi:hypothetical protein